MSNVNGFSLELEEYCSYCGEFKVDAVTLNIATLEDTEERYVHSIVCENSGLCKRLKESLEKGNSNE